MDRKIIPGIVAEQQVASLPPGASALEAAQLMTEKHCAAVIIIDPSERMIGIITERDITQRVVAQDKPPSTTLVSDVMTSNPDALRADDRAGDALELMQVRGYRHLPVVDDQGKCLAVVSIRDLYAAVKAGLEESIKETEAFVFGDRYGA